MFDIGWQEVFIVVILALIIVGPKDLPRVIRNIMGLVRKARLMARDFQEGIDDVVREADLNELKGNLDKLSDDNISEQIKNTINSTGELTGDLGLVEIEKDLNSTFNEKPSTDVAQSSGLSSAEAKKVSKDSQVISVKDD